MLNFNNVRNLKITDRKDGYKIYEYDTPLLGINGKEIGTLAVEIPKGRMEGDELFVYEEGKTIFELKEKLNSKQLNNRGTRLSKIFYDETDYKIKKFVNEIRGE